MRPLTWGRGSRQGLCGPQRAVQGQMADRVSCTEVDQDASRGKKMLSLGACQTPGWVGTCEGRCRKEVSKYFLQEARQQIFLALGSWSV